MSLNANEYVRCPYCAMSYKHNNNANRDAIAGHINLKHKDKPRVKLGSDYVVSIPVEADTVKISVGGNSVIVPTLKPIIAKDEPILKPKELSKKEKLKQELEQKLKELE